MMESEEVQILLSSLFSNEQQLLQSVSEYLNKDILSAKPLPKELWSSLKKKIISFNDPQSICNFFQILNSRAKEKCYVYKECLEEYSNQLDLIYEIDCIFIYSLNEFRNNILKLKEDLNRMEQEWVLGSEKTNLKHFHHTNFELEKIKYKIYIILSNCNVSTMNTDPLFLDTLFSIYNDNILDNKLFLAMFDASEEILFKFFLKINNDSFEILKFPKKLLNNEPFYTIDNLKCLRKQSVISGLCGPYIFFSVLLKAYEHWNWPKRFAQNLEWYYPFHLLLFVHQWTNSEYKSKRHYFEEALKHYIKGEPFVFVLDKNKKSHFNANILNSLLQDYTKIISSSSMCLDMPYQWFLNILEDCLISTSEDLLDNRIPFSTSDENHDISVHNELQDEALENYEMHCSLEYGEVHETESSAQSSISKNMYRDIEVDQSENKILDLHTQKISCMIMVDKKETEPSLEDARTAFIYTYQGYAALLYAHQIINIGNDMDKSISLRKNDHYDISEDDLETCNSFYENNVSELWSNVKCILNEISFISFKLEIMDALFSLLFTKFTYSRIECKGDFWIKNERFDSECSENFFGNVELDEESLSNSNIDFKDQESDSSESSPTSSLTLLISTQGELSSSQCQYILWCSCNINTLVAWDLLIILINSISNLEISSENNLTSEEEICKENLVSRMKSIFKESIALPLTIKLNKILELDMINLFPKLLLLNVALKFSDLSDEITREVFDFVFSSESLISYNNSFQNIYFTEQFITVLNKVKCIQEESFYEENIEQNILENDNYEKIQNSKPARSRPSYTSNHFSLVESISCTKPFITGTRSITNLKSLLPLSNDISNLLYSIYPSKIEVFMSFEKDLENLFFLSSCDDKIELSDSLRSKTKTLMEIMKCEKRSFNLVNNDEGRDHYLSVLATFIKMLTTAGCKYLRTSPMIGEYFYILKERPLEILGKFSVYLKTVPQFDNRFHDQSEMFSLILGYMSSPFEDLLEKNIENEEDISPLSRIHDELDNATLAKFGCSYMDGHYILNANKSDFMNTVCGYVVVKGLLSTLIKLIHDVNSKSGERIEITHILLPLYFENSEIKQLLLKCSELSSADLTNLVGKSLVFYVNLANLMFLHAVLLNCLIFKDSSGKVGLFAESKMEQLIAFKQVGYNVGHLGFVSLFDVVFKILKQPLVYDTHNVSNNSCLSLIDSNSSSDEYENMLVINNHVHPLLTFVVSQGMSPSPKIYVFDADTFEDDLYRAVCKYFLFTQDPCKPCKIKNPIMFTFLSRHPSGRSGAIASLKSILEKMEDKMPVSLINHLETADNDWQISEMSFSLSIIFVDYIDAYVVSRNGAYNEFDEMPHDGISNPISLSKTCHSYIENSCPMLLKVLANVNVNIEDEKEGVLPNPDYQFYDSESPSSLCKIYCPRFKTRTKGKIFNPRKKFECDFPFERFYANIIKSIEEIISTISESDFLEKNENSFLKMLMIVDFLTELPTSVVFNHFVLSFIWDNVMTYLANVSSQIGIPDSWTFVNKIKNTSLKFEAMKKNYTNWPVEMIIQCLDLLSNKEDLNSFQSNFVQNKLAQMQIYSEILHISSESFPFKNVKDLMTSSLEYPEVTLAHLVREAPITLPLKWIESHGFVERFLLQYIRMSLIQVFSKGEPDYPKAELILKDVKEDKLEFILKELMAITDDHQLKKFLISYYLENIKGDDLELVRKLQKELMGLILVEDVAPITANKSQLCSLISEPNLIIEQWIMNLKLDLVDKGIHLLSSILDSLRCNESESNSASTFNGANCLCWKHFHLMIEHYATKALDLSGSRSTLKMKNPEGEDEVPFVMPPKIPKQSEWEENSTVSICPVCKISVFSVFCRRHHCRRCGRVVCGDCSLNRLIILGYGEDPVRVCQLCFENMSDSTRSGRSSETEDISDKISIDSIETGWYLTTDPSHNEFLREEFNFDYAPTVNACHSLFIRHKDDNRAAICILGLCHIVFKAVVDSISGLNDYDQQFLLKILQTLIPSAKVRFGKLGNGRGIFLCEYNSQWVFRLQLLLKSNCTSLIPAGTLTNMLRIDEIQMMLLSDEKCTSNVHKEMDKERQFLRILIDNLVKNKKFDLALDISTKEGFEKNGILGASAISSLKRRDFKIAREIFSKILKPIKDKNIDIKVPLLCEIISILENPEYMVDNSGKGSYEAAAGSEDKFNVLAKRDQRLLRVLDWQASLEEKGIIPENGEYILSAINKLECEYYLKLYGSHRLYLQFQIRHDGFKESLKYSRDNNINEKLFATEVILSSFRRGKLEELWENLRHIDPDERWSSSIISCSCHYMDKMGFLRCLLSVLKLLSDNVRAFWTLIKLYSKAAESYTDLQNKNSCLLEAICHLQACLHSCSDNVQTAEKSPSKLCHIRLHCPSSEVNFLLSLANIQVKITKYLCEYENSGLNIRPKIIIIYEIMKKIRMDTKPDSKLSLKSNSIKAIQYVPTVFDENSRFALATLLLCVDEDTENSATNLSLVRQFVDWKLVNLKEVLAATIRTRILSGDMHNEVEGSDQIQEYLTVPQWNRVMLRKEEKKRLSSVIKCVLKWNLIPDSEIKNVLTLIFFEYEKILPRDIAELLIEFTTNWCDKADVSMASGNYRLAYNHMCKNNDSDRMQRLLTLALERPNKVVVKLCQKWLERHKD